jgi:predicted nucleotide-binding protein
MSKENFQVAVMHGHSKDYLEIKKYIVESKYTARILIEEYSADTIFENLRNLIWDDIHCVIVLLTKDDELKNGDKRARQNVVFELGYCFGAFDSLPSTASYKPKDALIVIAEKGVQLFADIDGLTRIVYETGELTERKLAITSALNKSYTKAKKYYGL